MTRSLARLEIFHFRHALAAPVSTVMGPLAHRPALLVRIEDAEGASGWGEIWCNFPPGGDLHRARLAAGVAQAALSGLDAGRPAFAQIRARLHRLAIQAGEPGPVAQIAAGFDIALVDLDARRAGLPLARHLGGVCRDVPAYASGIAPDAAGQQVERMRARGYRIFKQRIGFGRDDGIASAQETAAGLGPGERLMLDANQAWDLDTAVAQGGRIARLDPVWLEEPIPADAPSDDWTQLANRIGLPLAAGENLAGDAAFADAIAAGALRYLQPDICKWGGLSSVVHIARQAEAAGLVYCPHFLGGGIGLLASAHLLAAVGGPGLLEVDSSENPLLDIFAGDAVTLEDGHFRLPEGPGFGPPPDIEAARPMLTSHEEVRL